MPERRKEVGSTDRKAEATEGRVGSTDRNARATERSRSDEKKSPIDG
ncbi:hypothetical protein [Lysinibacillus xylanilyticus]|nr:hypothetical protein [Lysinibacillus xylanilyticus]